MILTTNKCVVVRGNSADVILQTNKLLLSIARKLESQGLSHDEARELIKSPLRMALMMFDGKNADEIWKAEKKELNKISNSIRDRKEKTSEI